MSEAVTKTVTGRCAEISERGEWTAFSIEVDGWEHPIKLSTKLAPLIELGRAASKDGGAFDWTYKESQGKENPHRPGTYYMDRYLSGVEAAGSSAAAPDSALPPGGRPESTSRGEGMTKEEWARKDSAIHKMACIKTAADALKHTVPADPTSEDLNTFLQRVTHLTLAWHRQVLAERDDPAGEDIPFD